MNFKPFSASDAIRINLACALNALHHRTGLSLFRVFGDNVIRYSKVVVDDVIYVLVDLSSLYIISPNHEQKVANVLNAIPSGGIFIDVGAHIGKYSLKLAMKGVKVIAIEPDPITFRALTMGTKLNRFENVKSLNIALSDHNGVATFYRRRSSDASSIKKPDYAIAVMKCIVKKLDTLVQEMGLRRIDYIKIDVEGAEIEVIRGSLKTLAKFKPSLIVECENGNIDQLSTLLTRLGYELEVLERYEKYSNLLCRAK